MPRRNELGGTTWTDHPMPVGRPPRAVARTSPVRSRENFYHCSTLLRSRGRRASNSGAMPSSYSWLMKSKSVSSTSTPPPGANGRPSASSAAKNSTSSNLRSLRNKNNSSSKASATSFERRGHTVNAWTDACDLTTKGVRRSTDQRTPFVFYPTDPKGFRHMRANSPWLSLREHSPIDLSENPSGLPIAALTQSLDAVIPRHI